MEKPTRYLHRQSRDNRVSNPARFRNIAPLQLGPKARIWRPNIRFNVRCPPSRHEFAGCQFVYDLLKAQVTPS